MKIYLSIKKRRQCYTPKNFNYSKYLIIMINIEIILLIIFALNNEIISDDFILIFSTIVSGILPFSILEILFYIENKK